MYKNLRVLIVTVGLFVFIALVGGVRLINESAWNNLKESYFEAKTDQIKYFIKVTDDKADDILYSHAVWTEARQNLINHNTEWLNSNATGYLIDHNNFNVNYVFMCTENLDYINSYGADFTETILHSNVFNDALKSNEWGSQIIWIKNNPVLFVASPVYDENLENPTGVYLIGIILGENELNDLIELLGRSEINNLSLDNYAKFSTNIAEDYQIMKMSYPIELENSIDYINIEFKVPIYNYIFEGTRNNIFIIIMVIIIVGVVVVLRFIKQISLAVTDVISAVMNISKGNYKNKLIFNSTKIMPELNELVDSVNLMSTDIEKHNKTINDNYLEMIELIANVVQINDSYTYRHNQSVANYAKLIGEAIGYEDIKTLELSAKFHDIGKISIPSQILNKPGKLTEEEYEIIKKHPIEGYKIIKNIEYFKEVSPGVKYHHERYDGKGYPEGLKGEEIPLIAQIIAVADVYDALTSDRAYRKAMSCDEAMKIILDNSGAMFNPMLVEVFYEKNCMNLL